VLTPSLAPFQFQAYVDWDNRRNNERGCLSLDKLRRIVTEGTAIHANIGTSVNKMARVLSQAETWFEKNVTLLVRAGILKVDGHVCVGFVTLPELTNAVSDASAGISLDLQEAVALQEVVDKIQRWVDRTGNAAPIKRSKRVGKGRWSCKPTRFRVADLVDLIEEAKTLPIPTDEEVQRLKTQLEDVYTWRLKAYKDLREIANGFHSLGAAIQSIHGSPEDFFSEESRLRINADENLLSSSTEEIPLEVETTTNPMDVDDTAESEAEGASGLMDVDDTTEYKPVANSREVTGSLQMEEEPKDEGGSQTEVSSNRESETNLGRECKVDRSIAVLLNEARQTGVMTTEEEVVASLDSISKWCTKTLKALESPNDLYEKRTFAQFNALIEAGEKLLQSPEDEHEIEIDQELARLLRTSWSVVVKEQLDRLEKLRGHRDKFVEWSKSAQVLISAKEKKVSFEAIDALVEQSRAYPSCKLFTTTSISRRLAI
jgi:hypothetical protein